MRKIFLLIILIIIAESIFGIDVSGNQSGTWTFANSPYNVIEDVTVVSGTTLIIEPGVIVNFNSNKKLTIIGDLQAVGTLNDSIYFKSDNTWNGIKIENTDSSNLIFCVISNSDNSGITISNGTDITIRYSHIYNNTATIGGGINIINDSSWITIEVCEINNNQSSQIGSGGGGISTSGGHHFTISGCSIYENVSMNFGGGVLTYSSSYVSIEGMNNIYDNQAVYGGGIAIYKGAQNNIVANVITSNDAVTSSAYGGGIYLLTACNIIGNYISYNTSEWNGGGIYASTWSVEEKIISHNSIFENVAIRSGGGIYVSGYPKIESCTIYDNIANYSGGGICVYGYNDGVLEINESYIHHNEASTNAGGGIYARASSPHITKSTISFNEANVGGGVYIVDDDDTSVIEPGISNIDHCVVYGNLAYEECGGLMVSGENTGEYAVIECTNSILYDNTSNLSQEGDDLYIETITGQSIDSVVKYNCISQNGLYISGDSDYAIIDNNISNDPLFLNVGYDNYNLNVASPCIDTGDPTYPPDPDESTTDMGRHYYEHLNFDIHHLSKGFNWVSFPRLDRVAEDNDPADIVPELNNIDPFNYSYLAFEEIDDTPIFTPELKYENNEWDPDDYNVYSSYLYKIMMTPSQDRILTVDGDRLAENFVLNSSNDPRFPLELGEDEYLWLGFWLPRNQKMIESFGSYWDDVVKVKSEDWFYSPANNNERGGDPNYPIALDAENLILQSGKGYMVLFENPTSITEFDWTLSDAAEEPEKKAESENFTYTEKADYEAIDVFNIPPNVSEIGVFEDGVCVGAVVVEDTCAQILVYSDNANRSPIPFTLEMVTGRGFSTPINNYQVMDMETGKYEAKSIFSGRQEYSVIRFADEDEPENNTISTPQLHGNYPNPFNPTTSISFSLPEEQEIDLTIYNIKGQKVKRLINGQLTAGQHSMIWDGKDTNDKSVGTGIYFYKLKTENDVLTRKMLMLK